MTNVYPHISASNETILTFSTPGNAALTVLMICFATLAAMGVIFLTICALRFVYAEICDYILKIRRKREWKKEIQKIEEREKKEKEIAKKKEIEIKEKKEEIQEKNKKVDKYKECAIAHNGNIDMVMQRIASVDVSAVLMTCGKAVGVVPVQGTKAFGEIHEHIRECTENVEEVKND